MKSVVFIIEDEESIVAALDARLKTEGFEVRSFPSAQAFLQAEFQVRSGCILLDLRLPAVSGTELLSSLRKKGCHLPVIVISAYDDAAAAVDAIQAGACDFIEKPFDAERLVRRIHQVLREYTVPGVLTRVTKRLTPSEADDLFQQIVPRLVTSVLEELDRSANVGLVRRITDHLCLPEVRDRLRRCEHVRDGLVGELTTVLKREGLCCSLNRGIVMNAVGEGGAMHTLLALEACLAHPAVA